MTASKTSLPVLGVPVQSKTLGGLDSLLSIVQMPAGIPVATFAIGVAGATNAALCAASILANKYPADRDRARSLPRAADRRRARQSRSANDQQSMTVGIVGAGQLGRMLALAGYPLGLDFLFLDPAQDAPAGQVAPVLTRRLSRSPSCSASCRERSEVAHLRLGKHLGRCAACARRATRGSRRRFPPLATAQDRVSEKKLFERLGIPTTRWRAVGSRAQLTRAVRDIGLPGVIKTRRLGYDGKGQAVVRTPDDAETRLGGNWARYRSSTRR